MLWFVIGCRERPSAVKKSPEVPLVDATVYTYQVTTDRPGAPRIASLTVAGSKVRVPDELDVWRLIDTEKRTVTTIDAVAKTYHEQPLEELIARRRRESRMPVPPDTPMVRLTRTGERVAVAGISATRWLIEMGEYRRELYISDSPQIHPQLFRLWLGSEALGGALVARMAPVHLQLMNLEGLPLLERITLTAGARKFSLERKLQKVEKKRVPAAMFEIPSDFRNLDAPENSSGAGKAAANARR